MKIRELFCSILSIFSRSDKGLLFILSSNFLLILILILILACSSKGQELPTSSPPNNSSDRREGIRFRLMLTLAQEEAKCLLKYGEISTVSSKIFYCSKDSPLFAQCEKCRGFTDEKFIDDRGSLNCEEICGSSEESCLTECTTIQSRLLSNETESDLGSRVEIDEKDILLFNGEPELFCEDMSKPNSSKIEEFHYVVIRWSFPSHPTHPIIYIVERKGTQWEVIGKTSSSFEKVAVPYLSQKYKWRVTGVGPQGKVGEIITKNDITTLNGFVPAEPPKKIYIKEEVIHENSVDILVEWEAPDDKPCDYKVVTNRQDSEEKSISYRLTAKDLSEGLRVWFYGLKFRHTYDVVITSRRANWDGYQSDLKSKAFTMPSCLEAHRHRFDKCVPPPPRNITQERVIVIHEEGDGLGRVKIKWVPPQYSSLNNTVRSYFLIFGSPYNPKNLTSSPSSSNSPFGMAPLLHRSNVIYIPGNVTELMINNVTLNKRYPIAVISNSLKGNSTPAYFTVSTNILREENGKTVANSWVYLSIPISIVIFSIFACHFLRVFVQKRQVKLARNQYFQSMEERDAMAPDWSIVPLHEDSPSNKLFIDPCTQKWEIRYEDLHMGEVVGQGAFGVVRRAKVSRTKLMGTRTKNNHDGHKIENLDELQTVAVKMLKVSATRDDRDQLVKEILTMQNLGAHPQIVSLLGACTKGRSLCLVLEYCPGGDLLSFLRKVRCKYWPTLGLQDSQRSQSESSIKSRFISGREPELFLRRGESSSSSYRKSTDSSPINYADIEGSSSQNSHGSSADKTSPSTTTVIIDHEYGNSCNIESDEIKEVEEERDSFESSEEDCRPITEKDILSYARQIAMGMEYLEKNRVVHRDLAGRNVLLLGDHKQVKISDFGLSRDVYTWNVYHQKSNGKLPIKWMAIESIFTHVFTAKSDVWSFGILLWELVTLGGSPYPGLGNNELFHHLKSGYRMERPDNCSEELYALMKKCWRTTPVSRPSFTELRRYLETMLEAAEPSLYLSLMADLPVDYFNLNSKSDILSSRLDEGGIARDSSGSCRHNRRSSTKYKRRHCKDKARTSEGIESKFRPLSSPTLDKNRGNLSGSLESLVSPESIVRQGEESEDEELIEEIDTKKEIHLSSSSSPPSPFSITIIENKTYDINIADE